MSAPELRFTRRFSMGHRLISGSSERCAIPHGHNEFVSVSLRARNPKRLDGKQNVIVPFANAKTRWHHFIDMKMDHAFQISEHDPLLRWFIDHEPERAARLVVTPGDPTTELLAALLYAKLNAFLKQDGDILHCIALSIEETPTNTVLIADSPQSWLPLMPKDDLAYWWHRADDSISDLIL